MKSCLPCPHRGWCIHVGLGFAAARIQLVEIAIWRREAVSTDLSSHSVPVTGGTQLEDSDF